MLAYLLAFALLSGWGRGRPRFEADREEREELAEWFFDAFGRPVDLVARVALHPMLVETVLGEARPLSAA